MKTKKQLLKKCDTLSKQYDGMSKSYSDLLQKNIDAHNKIDDITQLKESLQLQNQTLEKRLLATEVELLRKIVKLYEDKHTTSYPQYNGNGITTSTTNTTMLGV